MNRRVAVLIALVFVIANIVVIWSRIGRHNAGPAIVSGLANNKSETAMQLQGHPHIRRVETEIAAVAARDEDELIQALDLQWVVFYSGVEDHGEINPELDFPRVLADRNLRKLSRMLNRYDEGARGKRVQQLFKLALERHIALKEMAIESLDHPPPVYENPADIPKPDPISGRRIALCGVVFLAAKYEGVSTVEEMLSSIDEYADAIPRRIEGRPYADDISRVLMVQSFVPDKAFLLNVLLYAAEHDRTISSQQRYELKQLIGTAQQRNVLKTVEVEVCTWDAKVDWFDLAVLMSGPELLDRSKGTEMIAWHKLGGSGGKRDLVELIARIRKVIGRE